MKYQVQASGGSQPSPIEADEITEKDNMYVFLRDEKTIAMFSKSYLLSVVAVDESK